MGSRGGPLDVLWERGRILDDLEVVLGGIWEPKSMLLKMFLLDDFWEPFWNGF